MTSQRPICRDFLRGRCRRTICKFAHVQPASSTQVSITIDQTQRPETRESQPQPPKASNSKQPQKLSNKEATEHDLQAWKHMISPNTKAPRPSAAVRKTIFLKARQLIDREGNHSEKTRQEVVQTLASKNGLRLVMDLVEDEFENMSLKTIGIILRSQLLPFLETLTCPEVLSSPILSQAIGTVYNALYGTDGTTAAHWLNLICDTLETDKSNSSNPVLLQVSLRAFHCTIDFNSTALLQKCLQAVAQRFEVLCRSMSIDKMANIDQMANKLDQTQSHLERLLQRMEIASSVSTRAPKTQPKSPVHVSLIHHSNPPGGRHNNDFVEICQIKMMPSFDEICCPRAEYLPVNDPTQWHVDGIDGLLDRNFRLLREDTVGHLRDAIHREIAPHSKQCQSSLRTFVYHEARLLNVGFNWLHGLYFEVDFPQPARLDRSTLPMRQMWWEKSKRLEAGALVCLIIQKNLVLFCTVANQAMMPRRKKNRDSLRKIEPTSLWNDQKRASVKLMLVDSRFTNVQLILDLCSPKNPPISVVEFSGVLLQSFEPSLKALQNIKATHDLPFSDLFVPWALKDSSPPEILPPLYASEPGSAFNLRCLLDNDTDFFVGPTHEPDPKYLQEHSTLDAAQAHALIGCLERQLGLVQGPPGTGKSYTGVALIKVLLANRNIIETDLGPIICVTYTNHALDQLLESLLDHKITSQIVRIGSQSKSERLEEFNLNTISRILTKAKGGRKEKCAALEMLLLCEDQFHALDLQKQIPVSRLKLHIKRHNIRHYNQLFVTVGEEGFLIITRDSPQATFESWLDSGVDSDAHPRAMEELENINVFEMSRQERLNIHSHWCREYRRDVDQKVTRVVESHGTAKLGYDAVHDEMHLRCLAQADVIGVTTSGLARRLDLFRRLSCKIMICEEAGEVLESHLLTAFLPSVQHAILIGDQQQLRPHVQNYGLSSENPQGGAQYSLDISLFERLVSSNQTPMDCGYSFSALETQRRMHPSISRMLKETSYPNLKDDPSVSRYPEVSGIQKRLFWLDHRSKEGRGETADTGGNMDGDANSTSHWNDFEVEMSIALVRHLVRQNEYKAGDIAVLTPYLGQLHKLRQGLTKSFAITMGERDQDNLARAHMDHEARPEHIGPESLSDTIRVATVDNFQGEEAKIVVISLVRSNSRRQCGFLQTPNRINVLLSRAQHGMYIIGNSETSIHVPMWAQVIDILKQGQNIGMALELQCPRHPNRSITVSKPGDFAKFSPEGGCNQRCIDQLECGHACVKKCHSEILHNAVICPEPCPRPLNGCTHPCPRQCGQPCPEKCLANLFDKNRILRCGHRMENLPCWQHQDTSKIRCPVRVEKTVPACSHTVLVPCYVDVQSKDYHCVVRGHT